MKRFKAIFGRAVVVALCSASTALALTPQQLKRDLDKRVPLTLIDVRSTDHFAIGHIPGAINIPAGLIAQKQLPPLGRVVVYDGGLGGDAAAKAVATLNAKPGIKAEVLDGGFAAWEAVGRQTTRGRGVEQEVLPMATYQQVKTNATDDLVLVDLRKAAKSLNGAPAKSLAAEFPNARVVSSPFGVQPKNSGGAAPLIVLVDQGDGSAEQMARALRANGQTRFVILAGGDEIIQRQGEPGLKRSGTTVTTTTPPNLPAN
jgi:rhodanese-related sulfurtransferase